MRQACGTYGERRDLYRFVVGTHGGKRPPGSPELRWEDNIRMVLKKLF
jgi:hypothetical protein